MIQSRVLYSRSTWRTAPSRVLSGKDRRKDSKQAACPSPSQEKTTSRRTKRPPGFSARWMFRSATAFHRGHRDRPVEGPGRAGKGQEAGVAERDPLQPLRARLRRGVFEHGGGDVERRYPVARPRRGPREVPRAGADLQEIRAAGQGELLQDAGVFRREIAELPHAPVVPLDFGNVGVIRPDLPDLVPMPGGAQPLPFLMHHPLLP